MMIDLCRQYRFRAAHRASVHGAGAARAARRARGGAADHGRDLSALPALRRGGDCRWRNAAEMRAADPRARANREALWQGLREGAIDMVVTDHSPCPPAMKRTDEGRFDLAWGGIASLSVALPVIWTDASAARLCAGATLSRWMSAAPAALAGLSGRAGALEPGATRTSWSSIRRLSCGDAGELHSRHRDLAVCGREAARRGRRRICAARRCIARASLRRERADASSGYASRSYG